MRNALEWLLLSPLQSHSIRIAPQMCNALKMARLRRKRWLAPRLGKRDTRQIARADEAHQPRGRRSRKRRDREDARRGEAQGTREVSRPGPCARICARMRGLTPNEGSLAERGCGDAPPTRQRATAGNAGKRGGRRADGGAAAKSTTPKAISRLPSGEGARRMPRKPRAQTPPGIFRRFASTAGRHGKQANTSTQPSRSTAGRHKTKKAHGS